MKHKEKFSAKTNINNNNKHKQNMMQGINIRELALLYSVTLEVFIPNFLPM